MFSDIMYLVVKDVLESDEFKDDRWVLYYHTQVRQANLRNPQVHYVWVTPVSSIRDFLGLGGGSFIGDETVRVSALSSDLDFLHRFQIKMVARLGGWSILFPNDFIRETLVFGRFYDKMEKFSLGLCRFRIIEDNVFEFLGIKRFVPLKVEMPDGRYKIGFVWNWYEEEDGLWMYLYCDRIYYVLPKISKDFNLTTQMKNVYSLDFDVEARPIWLGDVLDWSK